jgi:hypothetical protein
VQLLLLPVLGRLRMRWMRDRLRGLTRVVHANLLDIASN